METKAVNLNKNVGHNEHKVVKEKFRNLFLNRFSQGLKKYKNSKYLFILLLPTLIYFGIFHYAPMYGIQIAFKDYKFSRGIWGSEWIGFEHFKLIFQGDNFLRVFKNTLIISGLKFAFGFPAPIILAILLNEIRVSWFKRSVQTISYLPHFLSWIILSGIVKQFLSPSIGPVGYIMKALNMEPIYFVVDPNWFRPVLVVTSIWKEVGWGTIIYLAGMANVNPEIYEAATVDGASRFQKAVKITLPSLVPIITFVFILSMGNIIHDDFDQIFNLMNPGVMQVSDVISTYTYRMGMVLMQYSYGAAVGLFKNVIAIALIFLTNYILKKISDNEYRII